MPWKIGDFMFRNINKIYKFANHFKNVNLKYVEKIKGFDPNKIFVEHMISVQFNNSFTQTILNEEEEGNNPSTPIHDAGDLETLLSSNDFYKKRGKGPSERSAQCPVVTPKNTTSWNNAPMTHPVKKVVNSSSIRGGEKNPPRGKIESSHKLLVRKKMKNLVQEDNLIENDIQIFALEDMELEVDVEKIFPTMEQPKNMARQNSLLEVIANETFSEEESFTFQTVVFDKESKKMIVEISDQENKKGKSCSEVDLKDMRLSQISKIHRKIRDSLDNSIDGLEDTNSKLKERIKELENALVSLPILASPFSIVKPTTPAIKLK
jgi:hypothetical protein